MWMILCFVSLPLPLSLSLSVFFFLFLLINQDCDRTASLLTKLYRVSLHNASYHFRETKNNVKPHIYTTRVLSLHITIITISIVLIRISYQSHFNFFSLVVGYEILLLSKFNFSIKCLEISMLYWYYILQHINGYPIKIFIEIYYNNNRYLLSLFVFFLYIASPSIFFMLS